MRSGGLDIVVPDGSDERWSVPQRLAEVSEQFQRVDVFAPSGNSGTVYVGFHGTNAGANAAGCPLAAGDAYSFTGGVDLVDIYVAGTTDGDRLTWNAK